MSNNTSVILCNFFWVCIFSITLLLNVILCLLVIYMFPFSRSISISKLYQFQFIFIICKNLFLYKSSMEHSYILLQLLFFQILTFMIYRGIQLVWSTLIILKYRLQKWHNTSAILRCHQQIALLRSIE